MYFSKSHSNFCFHSCQLNIYNEESPPAAFILKPFVSSVTHWTLSGAPCFTTKIILFLLPSTGSQSNDLYIHLALMRAYTLSKPPLRGLWYSSFLVLLFSMPVT